MELSSQRTGNGFGPNALQFTEVEAWQRFRGIRLKPWEVRALFSIDRAYLMRCGEIVSAVAGGGQEVSEQPLTGDLFDKMFK